MLILNIFNKRADVGGEDIIFQLVDDVIAADIGHVSSMTVSRQRFASSILNRIAAFFSGIFSVYSFLKFLVIFLRRRPDIIHVHNIFPFVSPAVFLAAKILRIPSLYHCHNFHLSCPVGSHFRNGLICNDCSNSNGFSSVRYNCRGNFFESFAYWLRFFIHRRMGLIRNLPTGIAVVSSFAKSKLIEAGFDNEKIYVLPNGVDVHTKQESAGKNISSNPTVLYVGRLTLDKGLIDLITLAQRRPNWIFWLVGSGPLEEHISSLKLDNVVLHGWKVRAEINIFYQKADVAVVPSWCYETFGLAAAEAMAAGVPTVVANHGGLADFLDSFGAVSTYEPRNVDELETALYRIISSDKVGEELRSNALALVEEQYSIKVFSMNLKQIYKKLLSRE
jgi:glycosyltransferase involved in cell wall biosynthesis